MLYILVEFQIIGTNGINIEMLVFVFPVLKKKHVECDVENKTKCYMYFDARYSDPNMHYDDENDSWSYHPTPGLFRNAIKV